jgi:hypothetical protein
MPGYLGASFVVGRRYDLSGFIDSDQMSSVALTVKDQSGSVVDAMSRTQDVSGMVIPSMEIFTQGRAFDLPLVFPEELAGQAVTITLTFTKGLRGTWSASERAEVLPEHGPTERLYPQAEPKPRRVLGDANGDGKADAADAVQALRLAIGLDPMTDDLLFALDVSPRRRDGTTGDNRVNLLDAQQIIRGMEGRLR